MSDGCEFHRCDSATGKERRPTVVSRGTAAQAASVTMKNEVGGDRVGQNSWLRSPRAPCLISVLHRFCR